MSDVAADDMVLRVERLIPMTPERLFDLWTEPAQLAKWWGPEGHQIPTVTMDVRPGGAWRTIMIGGDGKRRVVSGVYHRIEKPKRLVLTWGWDNDNGTRGYESEITVLFEPAPGGTRIVLTQQRFTSKTDRDNHGYGWNSSFNKLARLGA